MSLPHAMRSTLAGLLFTHRRLASSRQTQYCSRPNTSNRPTHKAPRDACTVFSQEAVIARARLTAFTALLLLALASTGCGGGSAQSNVLPSSQNAVPAVSSVSPSSVVAGSGAFTLTVNGTGFVAGSVVQWNGSARPTTFVSAAQLTAAITTADVAATGSGQVTVVNPSPGGGTSSAASVTIQNPVPAITSVSPATVIPGSAAFTLTVNGTGFVASSVVQWNGSARPTTFVS